MSGGRESARRSTPGKIQCDMPTQHGNAISGPCSLQDFVLHITCSRVTLGKSCARVSTGHTTWVRERLSPNTEAIDTAGQQQSITSNSNTVSESSVARRFDAVSLQSGRTCYCLRSASFFFLACTFFNRKNSSRSSSSSSP